MITAAAIVVALAILGAVLQDAFEVMLLPRRIRRRLRLVRAFFTWTWRAWTAVALRIPPGHRRDAFVSFYGPLSLVALLVIWACGLILGFGILTWALALGGPAPLAFPTALYVSGATFFTLAYGDMVPRTTAGRVLAVMEAGTGLGFIAVVIGYLPVLYQLFSRREGPVIILDERAGSPPSATALLVRHAEGESLDRLDELLASWERWAAELVESHLSYPMLGYYRSQHDNQSWLAALTAVMDTCALVMVGFPGVRTFQARMTFAAARLAVVELSRVFVAAPRPPHSDRLGAATFATMRQLLEQAGLPFSDDATAEQTLDEFRKTYEPFVNGLASQLLMTLPPWVGDPHGDALDNWQRSRRGRTVKRLVEGVPAKPA